MRNVWGEVRVDEVADEVFRIVTPLPLRTPRAVNAYVLRHEDEWLMVDGGWPSDDSWDNLMRGLAALGRQPRDVRRVLLTHGHPDHAGLAARMQLTEGADIYMDGADRSREAPRDSRRELYDWLIEHGVPRGEAERMRSVTRGLPRRGLYLTFRCREGEDENRRWFGLEVIPTPGHSRGSVCLFEPRRQVLFSGDTVLPDTTAHIGTSDTTGTGFLGDYLASLERLRAYRPKAVLPGHGAPFADLADRITDLVEHHRVRAEQVLTALTRPRTARDVAMSVHWRGRAGSWPQLDDTARWLAVTETVAHLEMLCDRGVIEQTRDAYGRFVYVRAPG